jgi:transcriptional regulator
MYVPKHFAEERIDVLHDTIERVGFATLVTMGSSGLIATHLPLILDRQAGTYGTLFGHVARGNPQWHDFDPSIQALAMFLGPEAYISPNWYPTKADGGRVVPTWNYLSVHAYGTLSTYEDVERLKAHVTRLTDTHEGRRQDHSPWHVSDAPAEFVDGLLKGIIGLALPIARIEGKWKMSQNRPEADKLGAIAGLEAGGRPNELAVAEVMHGRRA